MPDYRFDMFGPDREHYGPQGSRIVYNTGWLGSIVVILSALFAAVIVAALMRAETAASTAIIVGGLYFGAITLAALLVLSGSLSQIVVNRQEQITLRQYHQLQVSVVQPAALPGADPLQLPGTPPAPTAPPLGGNTYVPAEEMTVRRDAALWAVSLYGSDGQPDPTKINLKADRERPGRLRVAAPAGRLRVWLEGKKVLESVPYGVRLRLERYPDAQTLREILNG